MSNGEVTNVIQQVSLALLEEQKTRTQSNKKLQEEKYQPRTLVNETSTSTMLEEQLNINTNLL